MVLSNVELEAYCGSGRKKEKNRLWHHAVSMLELSQEQSRMNLLGLVMRRTRMMGLVGLSSRL